MHLGGLHDSFENILLPNLGVLHEKPLLGSSQENGFENV